MFGRDNIPFGGDSERLFNNLSSSKTKEKSETSSGGLFGNFSPNNPEVSTYKQPLFGSKTSELFGSKPSTNIFGSKSEKLSDVFGPKSENPFKPSVTKEESKNSDVKELFSVQSSNPFSSSNETSSLFIKKDINQKQNIFQGNKTGIFGSTEYKQKEQNLFGQKSETPKAEFEQKSISNIFLKQKESTGNVFGSTTDKLTNIFGISRSTISETPEGLFTSKFRNKTESATSGLFRDNNKESEESLFRTEPSQKLRGSIFGSTNKSTRESRLFGQRNNDFSNRKIIPPVKSESTRFERLTSKEELCTIKSIVAEGISDLACKKSILEKHFKKFGSIIRCYVTPSKNKAVIHYADHRSARRAKEKGHLISPKISPIKAIFYGKSATKSNSKIIRPTIQQKKAETEEEFDDDEEEGEYEEEEDYNDDYEEEGDEEEEEEKNKDEINEELESMSQGVLDFFERPKKPKVHLNLLDKERSEFLESRDKKLKESRRPRREDDPPLVGTCSDMCPERERYSRSYQNQLRIYEKLNGTPNHKAMIKEYSRSSADQDVPLSSEMRSGTTLTMTMNFILTNIIDRIENDRGSVDDWFGYLDSCGTSEGFGRRDYVENVGDWFEFVWSCTRSIRKELTQQQLSSLLAVELVEKCARFHIMCTARLLEVESHIFSKKLNDENLTKCLQTLKHLYYDLSLEGLVCSNESEFRAYEILMNMNDGNTLRMVQTLNNSVRRSKEVQFAMKTFSALNSNNYVTFFKLISKSTLLQGCILIRYFSQMRVKGLEIMIRAYCPPKSSFSFKISKITHVLGFENDEQCTVFCAHYGVTSSMEGELTFNPAFFSYPEELPRPNRAKRLVESKRNADWSVVINGGPLPKNPYLSYVPLDSFKVSSKMLTKKPLIESMINPVFIYNDLIDEICSEETEKVILKLKQLYEHSDYIANEILADVLLETVRDSIREAKNEEIQKRLKLEQMLNLAGEVFEEYLDEFVSEFTFQTVDSEFKNQKDLETKKKLDLNCQNILEALLSEVTSEAINQVCLTVLEQEKSDRIADMIDRKVKFTKKKAFNKWLEVTRKYKRRKEMLDNFPSRPGICNALGNSGVHPKALSSVIESWNNTEKLFKTAELADDRLTELILEPIDWNLIISECFPSFLSAWKLILCVPDLDCDSPSRWLSELLKKKLKLFDDNESYQFSYQNKTVITRLVTEDILTSKLINDDRAKSDILNGTSSVLFIHLEDEVIEKTIKRLENLLTLIPDCPSLPLIIFSNSNSDKLKISLNLQGFLDQNKLHFAEVYHVSGGIFDSDTYVKIKSAISVLLSRSSFDGSEGISQKSLSYFVDHALKKKFFNEVYRRSKFRCSDLSTLISFYNYAVETTITVLEDPKLRTLSWPIPEISKDLPSYWNKDFYLESLSRSLERILLPPLVEGEPIDVKKYFKSIRRSYGESSFSISKLNKILKNNISPLPWEEIIFVFIEYQISLMDTKDPFDPRNKEYVVAYFEDFLDEIPAPKFWKEKLIVTPNTTSKLEDDFIDSKITPECPLDVINQELNESKRFEEKLSKLFSDIPSRYTPSPVNTTDEQEPIEDEFGLRHLFERKHIPVISYLSPTLGASVTPVTVTTRLEVTTPAREVKRKRKSTKEIPKDTSLLSRLRHQIAQDQDANSSFEKRLKEAIE